MDCSIGEGGEREGNENRDENIVMVKLIEHREKRKQE
jgi:hypothetical protein